METDVKKTIRLFDQDVYIGEFLARVEDCVEENGQLWAALDQTAFYPEGGGQPGDTGTLGEVLVLDTREKDGVIWHQLSAPLAEGSTVKGVLDWNWRFRNMQNHTGEHIVSGIVHRLFGWDNVGFHMGSDAVTVDFNGPLTEEDLSRTEAMANQVVEHDEKVQVSYPSPEELANLDYRSKKEIHGQVRIVTIPGADVCACCGTHTGTTGEVALIKLLGLQNYKGGARVSMLSGRDALEDYRRKHRYIQEAMHLLSARPEEIAGRIRGLQEENQELLQTLGRLRRDQAAQAAQAIPEGAPFACLLLEGLSMNELREAVNQGTKRAGLVLGLSLQGETDCRYVLGGRGDVRPLGKALNGAFSGKGGGSAAMVQGNLTGKAADIAAWTKNAWRRLYDGVPEI